MTKTVFPKFHAQNMAASSERLISFSKFDTRDQFRKQKYPHNV